MNQWMLGRMSSSEEQSQPSVRAVKRSLSFIMVGLISVVEVEK